MLPEMSLLKFMQMGGIELAKLSEVENPSFFASFSSLHNIIIRGYQITVPTSFIKRFSINLWGDVR